MSNYFLKVDKNLFNKGLTPVEILIISQVAEFQSNTGDCFISDKVLAENFGVSESTIKREIKRLEELGYIERETKNVRGGRERHMKVNVTKLKMSLENDNKAQNELCTSVKMSFDKGQNDTIKDNINKINEKDNKVQLFQPTAETTKLQSAKGSITNPIEVSKEWIREQYRAEPNNWVSCCASKLVMYKPSGKYYKGI